MTSIGHLAPYGGARLWILLSSVANILTLMCLLWFWIGFQVVERNGMHRLQQPASELGHRKLYLKSSNFVTFVILPHFPPRLRLKTTTLGLRTTAAGREFQMSTMRLEKNWCLASILRCSLYSFIPLGLSFPVAGTYCRSRKPFPKSKFTTTPLAQLA